MSRSTAHPTRPQSRVPAPSSRPGPRRSAVRRLRRAAAGAGACLAVLTLCAAAGAPAAGHSAGAAPAAGPAPAAAGAPTGHTASAPVTREPGDRYTAREIHAFVSVFYGEHGPGPFARRYGVSDRLLARAAQHPRSDVLLCGHGTPRAIRVGPVTVAQSAAAGWATVTVYGVPGRGGPRTFTAYAGLDATRPLQLLDVACDVHD